MSNPADIQSPLTTVSNTSESIVAKDRVKNNFSTATNFQGHIVLSQHKDAVQVFKANTQILKTKVQEAREFLVAAEAAQKEAQTTLENLKTVHGDLSLHTSKNESRSAKSATTRQQIKLAAQVTKATKNRISAEAQRAKFQALQDRHEAIQKLIQKPVKGEKPVEGDLHKHALVLAAQNFAIKKALKDVSITRHKGLTYKNIKHQLGNRIYDKLGKTKVMDPSGLIHASTNSNYRKDFKVKRFILESFEVADHFRNKQDVDDLNEVYKSARTEYLEKIQALENEHTVYAKYDALTKIQARLTKISTELKNANLTAGTETIESTNKKLTAHQAKVQKKTSKALKAAVKDYYATPGLSIPIFSVSKHKDVGTYLKNLKEHVDTAMPSKDLIDRGELEAYQIERNKLDTAFQTYDAFRLLAIKKGGLDITSISSASARTTAAALLTATSRLSQISGIAHTVGSTVLGGIALGVEGIILPFKIFETGKALKSLYKSYRIRSNVNKATKELENFIKTNQTHDTNSELRIKELKAIGKQIKQRNDYILKTSAVLNETLGLFGIGNLLVSNFVIADPAFPIFLTIRAVQLTNAISASIYKAAKKGMASRKVNRALKSAQQIDIGSMQNSIYNTRKTEDIAKDFTTSIPTEADLEKYHLNILANNVESAIGSIYNWVREDQKDFLAAIEDRKEGRSSIEPFLNEKTPTVIYLKTLGLNSEVIKAIVTTNDPNIGLALINQYIGLKNTKGSIGSVSRERSQDNRLSTNQKSGASPASAA